jgi:hypothetical protein
MLLGRVPFENSDPVEVLRMHVEVEPRGLDDGELPGALQNLLIAMLAKEPKKRPPAKDLARELAAVQKTIPGLEKHALWELVPGGEPTAWTGSEDSALALEPTGEVDRDAEPGQAPAKFQPWNDPALAPRPSAAASRGMTGIGLGTLGFALFVCVLYILFTLLSGDPEPIQDPRVPELEAAVKRAEAEAGTAELERKRMAALMQEAAARLKLENEEDLARKELEPRRDTTARIIAEIAAMRETAKTYTVPGAGD